MSPLPKISYPARAEELGALLLWVRHEISSASAFLSSSVHRIPSGKRDLERTERLQALGLEKIMSVLGELDRLNLPITKTIDQGASHAKK